MKYDERSALREVIRQPPAAERGQQSGDRGDAAEDEVHLLEICLPTILREIRRSPERHAADRKGHRRLSAHVDDE